MNQKQRNYAFERVGGILESKLSKLREKHTTPAKRLEKIEKFDLIKSGKVKLVSRSEFEKARGRYSTPDFDEIFNFSKYETEQKFDEDRYEAEANPLEQEARRIKDQIMLGDAQEALELLNKFEST